MGFKARSGRFPVAVRLNTVKVEFAGIPAAYYVVVLAKPPVLADCGFSSLRVSAAMAECHKVGSESNVRSCR